MNDESNNLALPFIQPAQALKHVSFNEAISILDSLVQLVIEGLANEPPAAAQPGSRFIVSSNASSAWSGYEGYIAVRDDAGWTFLTPREGFVAWFKQEEALKIYSGGEWRTPPAPDALAARRLGVSASTDDTNRFSVSSPASLFNHAGTSHQMKINKASGSDTASMLFQSNWFGRAELGLLGTDQFSLKVSGDDGQWVTALTVNKRGVLTHNVRPAAKAFSAAGAYTPSPNTQRGFTTLSGAQGGMALGSAVAGGGNALTVPEAGPYLLCLNITLTTSSGYSVSLLRNGADTLFTCRCSSPSPLSLSRTTMASLNEGDTLTIIHRGSATVEEGSATTELIACRL